MNAFDKLLSLLICLRPRQRWNAIRDWVKKFGLSDKEISDNLTQIIDNSWCMLCSFPVLNSIGCFTALSRGAYGVRKFFSIYKIMLQNDSSA